MRAIIKEGEPLSLITHRQTRDSNYDNYPEKGVLRHSLVAEQQGLCCYCMGRIRPDASAMKIEHWRCQTRYRGEELNYRNLLGACLGGERLPFRFQHCDTRKGDDNLRWNPAEPAHAIEARVQYDPDGTIRSSDVTFDNELNQVLNLNLAALKNHRKAIFDAITVWWKKERAKLRRSVPRDRIERKRDKYMAMDGQLSPYCQVAVWLLKKKLARTS